MPANHDRDNTRLTYRVVPRRVQVLPDELDSTFWSRPQFSYRDTTAKRKGQTYTYYVKVADPVRQHQDQLEPTA